MLNLGWFSTGRDEDDRQLLQAVQDCISARNIDGQISFVFSDREPGQTNQDDVSFEFDRNTLFRPTRRHELAREFLLITLTLQSLSRGEINLRDGRVTDAQRRAISRCNLTHQVDEEVKGILR